MKLGENVEMDALVPGRAGNGIHARNLKTARRRPERALLLEPQDSVCNPWRFARLAENLAECHTWKAARVPSHLTPPIPNAWKYYAAIRNRDKRVRLPAAEHC